MDFIFNNYRFDGYYIFSGVSSSDYGGNNKVKRQLDKKEKELTEKSLKVRKEELKTLKEELEYSKDQIAKYNYNRELDDKWRDTLRRKVDRENAKAIQDIEFSIKQTQEVIDQVEDQLKNGVEPKRIAGID